MFKLLATPLPVFQGPSAARITDEVVPGAVTESQSHSWCEFSCFSCDACAASFTHTCVCLCQCLPSAVPVWFPALVMILSVLTGGQRPVITVNFACFYFDRTAEDAAERGWWDSAKGWLYPRVLERRTLYQVRFQDMIGGEHVFMYVYWYWTRKKAEFWWKHWGILCEVLTHYCPC